MAQSRTTTSRRTAEKDDAAQRFLTSVNAAKTHIRKAREELVHAERQALAIVPKRASSKS